MMPPPPLCLIRHGQTDLGAEARFLGRLDDPLNKIGRKQASNAGRWLAKSALPPVYRSCDWQLVSSPLRRAIETAEIILSSAKLNVEKVTTEPDLAEMSFGDWEGLTTHEVKEAFPEQRRARKKDRWNYAPPGGESFAGLAARVKRWLVRLDRPTIAVCHTGTIRVVSHVIGGMTEEEAVNVHAGYCSLWLWDKGKFVSNRDLPT